MFLRIPGGAWRWFRASLAGLLICGGASTPLFAQGAAEGVPPAEHLARYRAALGRLAHIYTGENVQIDCVETTRDWYRDERDHELHPRELTSQLWYAYCDGKQRLHITAEKPRTVDRVIVQNGIQDFVVSRQAAGAPYSVARFADGKESPKALDKRWLKVRSAPCFIPGLDEYPDVPAYPAMVQSPEFTFEEVRALAEPEGPGIKAFFHYTPRKEKAARAKGWIDLDPALGSVIRAYDFQLEVFSQRTQRWVVNKFSRTLSYQSSDGVAIPTRISTRFTTGGLPERAVEYQITRFAFGCAPASEFTLAGYGLGDLATPGNAVHRREQRTTLWVLLLLFGGGVLLFAVARALQARAPRRDHAVGLGEP
jgi:hypothetical protein